MKNFGQQLNGTFIVQKIDYRKEQERIKQEIEHELKYLVEQKAELKRFVSIGEKAEKELKEKEKRIQVLMTTYLGMEV